MDAEGAFPAMKDEQLGSLTTIARLPAGMASGASSVLVEVTLPDGSKAYGQTSMEMLQNAARAFAIKEQMEALPKGSHE
jgi:hypothetical protein